MIRLIIDAISIALLAAGAPSGVARAQALPTWQIADICAKESAPGQCAAFEGQALNVVSSSWAFVVDPIKHTCLTGLKSPLDHGWRLLAECIDAEALKARDRTAVKTVKTPAEAVPLPRLPDPTAAKSPASTSPAETPKQQ